MDRRRRLLPRIESLESRHLLAVVTWDGGGDNLNWEDPLNWDSDSLPALTDDVFLPFLGGPAPTEVQLSSSVAVQSLTITGLDYSQDAKVRFSLLASSSLVVASTVRAEHADIFILGSSLTSNSVLLNQQAYLRGADALLTASDVINREGSIQWDDNGGGFTSPFNIDGNYTQEPLGTFATVVDPLGNSLAGQVIVSGQANLNGRFLLIPTTNDPLDVTQGFTPFIFNSRSGNFSELHAEKYNFELTSPFTLEHNATNVAFHGNVYVVNSFADSGAGTLREAILLANASPDPSLIGFRVLGAPIVVLSALPAITEAVEINATQLGVYTSSPIIALFGAAAPPGTNGLRIEADDCIISGLAITNFGTGAGILVENASNIQIYANYLGVNTAGTAAAPNFRGVQLVNAVDSRIGDGTAHRRNVIGGNQHGISVGSSQGLTIQGNYIGTNRFGSASIANVTGVFVIDSTNLQIGGSNPGEGNLISGNQTGIYGNSNSASKIQGNIIGLDRDGNNPIPNSFYGMNLDDLPFETEVGGSVPGARNIISGNDVGIINYTQGIRIRGNYIGVDGTGTIARPNNIGIYLLEDHGVVGGSSPEEANVISGNRTGVQVEFYQWNRIIGNRIGLNGAGTATIGNDIGVRLGELSRFTSVGGEVPGEANIIVGNDIGVELTNSQADNQVRGNYIGLHPSLPGTFGNITGVSISNGASRATIGGNSPSARNIISGNSGSGVHISGASTNTNKIVGNWIGLGGDGTTVVANGQYGVFLSGGENNRIGDFTDIPGTGEGNVISGNSLSGIYVNGSNGETIRGNLIGLDAAGVVARPNLGSGIAIANGLPHTIGGTDLDDGIEDGNVRSRNVISGNAGNGIGLSGGPSDLLIQGNFIGTNRDGTSAVPNGLSGIEVSSSYSVLIGGSAPGAGNLISGNLGIGISTQQLALPLQTVSIEGNLIGTDRTGTYPIPNSLGGISVNNQLPNSVVVGGPLPQSRNVVSGNGRFGIRILSNSVLVDNNLIGTDRTGSISLGNATFGVVFAGGDHGILQNNTIAGNVLGQVQLQAGSIFNEIKGNRIGIGAVDVELLPGSSPTRAPQGIVLDGSALNQVGTLGAPNTIGYASVAGIALINGATSNQIIANRIGANILGNEIANQVGIYVDDQSSNNQFQENDVRFSVADNFLIEGPGTVLTGNTTAQMGGQAIRLSPSSLAPGSILITQVVGGITPLVMGEIQAEANSTYNIGLFSGTSPGQANQYLGSESIFTDASGFAEFAITPPVGQANGFIAATLTGLSSYGMVSTSELSSSVLATPAVILGLPRRSPEGTPITLSAFASTNPVIGYFWTLTKNGQPYAFESRQDGVQTEGGIQFIPDDEGDFQVSLRVLMDDGSQYLLGPYSIDVYNIDPTASFDYTPSLPQAGVELILTSSRQDPGSQDSLTSAWEVRYGTPTGSLVFEQAASSLLQASFTPQFGGFYYVTLTVDDGDAGVRRVTREIEVSGLVASAEILVSNLTVNEGDTVRAYVPESLLNRSEQYQFNWTLLKISGSSTTAFPFLIPSSGVIEFVPDDDGIYEIELVVQQGSTTLTIESKSVTALNVHPFVTIQDAPQFGFVGTAIALSSAVTDPGSSDTHSIDWTVERDRENLPSMSGTGSTFTFTPDAAGVYVVTAKAVDDDGGENQTKRVIYVSRENVPIEIQAPAGPFVEGGHYVFTVDVPESGAQFSWRAVAANGTTVASSTAEMFAFSPLQGGSYWIEVNLEWSDDRKAFAIYGPLVVSGVAPAISSIEVLSPSSTPIYEGTPVIVQAHAVDPRESIGLTYRWEVRSPAAGSFTSMSARPGEPSQIEFVPVDDGEYSVRLTVVDSQGLSSQDTITILIENANPFATMDAICLGGSDEIVLVAIANDPGVADVPDLQFEWSINGGTYSAPSPSSEFTVSRIGLVGVDLRITDGDGGVFEMNYYVVQGSPGNDVIHVNAATESASGVADFLLVLGLDGNDIITIDASVTKRVIAIGGDGDDTLDASSALGAVVLIGGSGDDTLLGGSGDDLLIAGSGNNILVGGEGNNRLEGGGNDSMYGGSGNDYYVIHFSEVLVEDAGGYDIIDLSQSREGVTLNLSVNEGEPQAVFLGSTLAIRGAFEQLIGSPFDDYLETSTPGTILLGGAGNDVLVASGSDTVLNGGDGNNTLLLNDASGRFLTGNGNNTISGTLTSSGTTLIVTRDGDDNVQISGSSSDLANVSISLGDGQNQLSGEYLSGKIYAGFGGEIEDLDAFGSASSRSTITVSNSEDIGIFGSTTTGSSVTVLNSSDVSIYGSGLMLISDSSNVSIETTLFGIATSNPISARIQVTNSSDIGIYGSFQSDTDSWIASISDSTAVSIFGSATGKNQITIADSSDIGIFGSTIGTQQILVTNSSDIGIFGSVSGDKRIAIRSSSDIGIFGLSGGDIELLESSQVRIEASQFGSTASESSIHVTVEDSSSIGIFGSTSPTGPSLSATIIQSSDVGIFGSATGEPTTITVLNASDVGIFGSASPTGSTLTVSVQNSSDIGIFGSTRSGDQISVKNSQDIGIFNLADGSATLEEVTHAVVSASDFGIVSGSSRITVRQSSDIGIFGSTSDQSTELVATVLQSTEVGIFGSAVSGTISVSASSDIGIFGSTGPTTVRVASSENVGIYSGHGDDISIENSQLVRVEGGVFGGVSQGGIRVAVSGNSGDIGIFGTSLSDAIVVSGGHQIGLFLRDGEDQVEIEQTIAVVAFTDGGNDTIEVRDGKELLLHLGDGDDVLLIYGGRQIYGIGDTGEDAMIVVDGQNMVLDGGMEDDLIIVLGGESLILRGDDGQDRITLFGGVGIQANGGMGSDTLSVVGSLGGALDAGMVYALLDGQDGNDLLIVRPLLSLADRGLNPTFDDDPLELFPSWFDVPDWVAFPVRSSVASSLLLLGGAGDDEINLSGGLRLYALGGDGSDSIMLNDGSLSEISGGAGDDRIELHSPGFDNRGFGDRDNDELIASQGIRLGIFGNDGDDLLRILDGKQSFARGGLGSDTMSIDGGQRNTISGEQGNDHLLVAGGVASIAAGGAGNDLLEATGGNQSLLLGQSGRDHLRFYGGTSTILSGGDGDDILEAIGRGVDLYGDDGDDSYRPISVSSEGNLETLLVRMRELIFISFDDFDTESRGSDTLDLSSFSASATVNLGIVGELLDSNVGRQTVIPGQLELILIGAFDNIIGTDEDDILIGSSEDNFIDGRGGNDLIYGLDGNDLLIGGEGNDQLFGGLGDDRYVFEAVPGQSLGSDIVYELNDEGVDALDFRGMPVGLATLDLELGDAQWVADGLLSLSLRQGPSQSEVGEFEDVVGTEFDDIILGNGLDNRIEPLSGNNFVNGREGSDIYVFSGRSLGSTTIGELAAYSGRDTLDFAAFDAPLLLDLSLTSPQNLVELELTIHSGSGIENVIGTSFDDVILGNDRDNAIFGAGGADYLDGRAGNDRLVGDLPQIVYLDFDSAYRESRGDHAYTPAERTEIQDRLEQMFSPFHWIFTQSLTVAREQSFDLARRFVWLGFNKGRGGGISGDAGEVDFRNIHRSVTSEVNINPLLPTIREWLIDQHGDEFSAQELSNAIVSLTATIAAHELAHTAGLRHGDAFGPIGSGYYESTDLGRTYPWYEGMIEAVETGSRVMASPASVGTTIADALGITYFGERESIKLAFNETGRTRRELAALPGEHATVGTAESLGWLEPLYVPNLAPNASFARFGQEFRVSALAVIGELLPLGPGETERDFYRFYGQAGDIVNIELMANSLRPLRGTMFDSELRLLDAQGNQLAWNDDEFEGTKDATILDFILPEDGEYWIEIGLSEYPAFLSEGGRYELFLSRFAVGTSLTAVGDTLMGGTGSDTLIGSAADDLFLASSSLPGDWDVLDGREGADTLDARGFPYQYTATSIETILVDEHENRPPSVAIAGPGSGNLHQAVKFTFSVSDPDPQDANGPFEMWIDWGDGQSQTIVIPLGTSSIDVFHTYSTVSIQNHFAITAMATDSRGLTGASTTLRFTVTGWGVLPNPSSPGKNMLVLVGSHGADDIMVRELGQGDVMVRVRERESKVKTRGRLDGDIDQILVYGLGGNDRINLNKVGINAIVWGGEGNDTISGGDGDNVFLGESGNDVLQGGNGRNLLIGGSGADRIVGRSSDDLLIGGLTAFEDEFNQFAPPAFSSEVRLDASAQRLAWQSISSEWKSNRSYLDRVNNIRGSGTGPRSNGDFFLSISQNDMLGNSVFDDGQRDILNGSTGRDWYFASLNSDLDGELDTIQGRAGDELVDEIDRWW